MLWTKICSTYDKDIAWNKFYPMRKLNDICMKDTDIDASHLNDFDALWSHLQAQKRAMDDKLKCVFLLCTPPLRTHFAFLLTASTRNSVYNDLYGAFVS